MYQGPIPSGFTPIKQANQTNILFVFLSLISKLRISFIFGRKNFFVLFRDRTQLTNTVIIKQQYSNRYIE